MKSLEICRSYILLVLAVLHLAQPLQSLACSVAENVPMRTPVCDLNRSFGLPIKVMGPKRLFTVSQDGRRLLVNSALDREKLLLDVCDKSRLANERRCVVGVELASTKDPQKPHFFSIEVEIVDVNDHAPQFDQNTFRIYIDENSPEGQTFPLPEATDPDNGHNGSLTYFLEGHHSSSFTLLPPIPGTTSTKRPPQLKNLIQLDREVKHIYSMVLVASDGGSPPRNGSIKLEIEVRDINDNYPVFKNSDKLVQIAEDTMEGLTIATVTAYDRDPDSLVEITIPQSAGAKILQKFRISPNGELSLLRRLDFDTEQHEYSIPIIATDNGSPSRTATTKLNIRVTDVNDNSPKILISSFDDSRRFSVQENVAPGAFILSVTASDIDSGPRGELECSLRESPMFSLESRGGGRSHKKNYKLLSASKFDREARDNYTVRIVCSDSGTPPRSSEQAIRIWIGDVNDNGPQFSRSFLHAKVRENQPPGESVIELRTTDTDSRTNARTNYQILPEYQNIFKVNPKTGLVKTMTRFDREKNESTTFKAIAFDSDIPTLNSTVTVTVQILDENDWAPMFTKDFVLHVKEGKTGLVGKVKAEDKDDGRNSKITYSLSSETENPHLWSVHKDGNIYVRSPGRINREHRAAYQLVVLATDHGTPPRSSSATITVVVLDENDNRPVFISPSSTEETKNITQDLAPGSLIYHVQATDKDAEENGRIRYSLQKSSRYPVFFVIDEISGEIRLNRSLPLSGNIPRKLVISATDCGKSPLVSYAFLNIRVIGKGGVGSGRINKGSLGSRGLSREVVLGLGGGLVLMILVCLILLLVYFCHSLRRSINTGREVTANSQGKSSREMGLLYRVGICLCPCIRTTQKKRPSNTREEFLPIPCHLQNLKDLPRSRTPIDMKQDMIDRNCQPAALYTHIEDDNNSLSPYSQWHRPDDRYWEYATTDAPTLGVNRIGRDATLQYTKLATSGPSLESPYNNYHTYAGGLAKRTDLVVANENNESTSSEEIKRILLSGGSSTNQFRGSSITIDKSSNSKDNLQSGTTATAVRFLRHGGYVAGSPCYASSFV